MITYPPIHSSNNPFIFMNSIISRSHDDVEKQYLINQSQRSGHSVTSLTAATTSSSSSSSSSNYPQPSVPILRSSLPEDSWRCTVCQYLNRGGDNCKMCRTSRKAEKEDVLSGMDTDEDSTSTPTPTPTPTPVITQPVVKTSTIGTGMKLKRNVEVCQEMVVDYYHYYLETNASIC